MGDTPCARGRGTAASCLSHEDRPMILPRALVFAVAAAFSCAPDAFAQAAPPRLVLTDDATELDAAMAARTPPRDLALRLIAVSLPDVDPSKVRLLIVADIAGTDVGLPALTSVAFVVEDDRGQPSRPRAAPARAAVGRRRQPRVLGGGHPRSRELPGEAGGDVERQGRRRAGGRHSAAAVGRNSAPGRPGGWGRGGRGPRAEPRRGQTGSRRPPGGDARACCQRLPVAGRPDDRGGSGPRRGRAGAGIRAGGAAREHRATCEWRRRSSMSAHFRRATTRRGPSSRSPASKRLASPHRSGARWPPRPQLRGQSQSRPLRPAVETRRHHRQSPPLSRPGTSSTQPCYGPFLDELAVRASDRARAAIDQAKAGRFVEAARAAPSGDADDPAKPFLQGLSLFSQQQLQAASEAFRETLRAAPDFFVGAFYIGACYAAGGRDPQAVNAWQTSLVGLEAVSGRVPPDRRRADADGPA